MKWARLPGRRAVTHYSIEKEAQALVAAFLLWATAPASVGAVDASYTRDSFLEPKIPSSSVIGRATDGMRCQYEGSTSKIDCVYSVEGKDYIVSSALTPSFSRFGAIRFGTIVVTRNGHYAFANGESSRASTSGSGLEYCRLALQFVTGSSEIIWIWYDELFYSNGNQVARIDTNGDSHADLAVNGNWNGTVYGTRRWWTPDPTSAAYAADERSYPNRPEFTNRTSGHKTRGYKPTTARVLPLVPMGSSLSDTVSSKVPVWRTTTAP